MKLQSFFLANCFWFVRFKTVSNRPLLLLGKTIIFNLYFNRFSEGKIDFNIIGVSSFDFKFYKENRFMRFKRTLM